MDGVPIGPVTPATVASGTWETTAHWSVLDLVVPESPPWDWVPPLRRTVACTSSSRHTLAASHSYSRTERRIVAGNDATFVFKSRNPFSV